MDTELKRETFQTHFSKDFQNLKMTSYIYVVGTTNETLRKKTNPCSFQFQFRSRVNSYIAKYIEKNAL